MSAPDDVIPEAPAAPEPQELTELVDAAAVRNAMADIDSILLSASVEGLKPAAPQPDDEPLSARGSVVAAPLPPPSESTNTQSASAPGSPLSSFSEQLDSLVPPTPDMSLLPDVVALLQQDSACCVRETPQRHSEASELSSEDALSSVELPHTAVALLLGGQSAAAVCCESPRSLLQRIKHIRVTSTSARTKNLLKARRASFSGATPLPPSRRHSRGGALPH